MKISRSISKAFSLISNYFHYSIKILTYIVLTSTYIHLHTLTYAYIRLHTITYGYVRLRTLTYAYIHVHTFTYTYVNINTSSVENPNSPYQTWRLEIDDKPWIELLSCVEQWLQFTKANINRIVDAIQCFISLHIPIIDTRCQRGFSCSIGSFTFTFTFISIFTPTNLCHSY